MFWLDLFCLMIPQVFLMSYFWDMSVQRIVMDNSSGPVLQSLMLETRIHEPDIRHWDYPKWLDVLYTRMMRLPRPCCAVQALPCLTWRLPAKSHHSRLGCMNHLSSIDTQSRTRLRLSLINTLCWCWSDHCELAIKFLIDSISASSAWLTTDLVWGTYPHTCLSSSLLHLVQQRLSLCLSFEGAHPRSLLGRFPTSTLTSYHVTKPQHLPSEFYIVST